MIGKLHQINGKKMFACCDKELINTTIKTTETEINIKSSFYGKETVSKDFILENIKDCDHANIFGNKVCELLLENNLILKEQIIYFNKIAHVQIYKI